LRNKDIGAPRTSPFEDARRIELSDFIDELVRNGSEPLSHEAALALLQAAKTLIDDQAVEILHLRKQLFGQRSEKVSEHQLSLFTQVLTALVEKGAGGFESSAVDQGDEQKKKSSKNNRKPQKRRPLTPTRVEKIGVPEKERPCPKCGAARETVGQVPCHVVEYIPAKVEVIEYHREKVA
jgi:hypothetical protein